MVRPFTRIGSCRHEVALLNEAVGGKIDRSLVPRREPATHAVSLVPAHDVSGFLTSSGLRPVGRDVGEHDGGAGALGHGGVRLRAVSLVGVVRPFDPCRQVPENVEVDAALAPKLSEHVVAARLRVGDSSLGFLSGPLGR